MNAITRFHEMRTYAEQLERDGYRVETMQDGSIDVYDPIHGYASGVYAVDDYRIVRLASPAAARAFILPRS